MKYVTLKPRNILYLFLTLSLLGCSISNDDTDTTKEAEEEEEEILINQGSIIASVNGVSFSAVSNGGNLFDGTVAELNEGQNWSSLSIHGNDFENSKLKAITLVVFFENSFDTVSVGTE